MHQIGAFDQALHLCIYLTNGPKGQACNAIPGPMTKMKSEATMTAAPTQGQATPQGSSPTASATPGPKNAPTNSNPNMQPKPPVAPTRKTRFGMGLTAAPAMRSVPPARYAG